MKPMFKISFFIAFVFMIVFVIFKQNIPENKNAVAVVGSAKNKVESAPIFPRKENATVKNTMSVVKKDLPENPYLTKATLSSLPREIKEFLILDMKTIKSVEETKTFYNLLRSKEALLNAQKIILSINTQDLAATEREHLAATRFLTRAMGDLNNKSNKFLYDIVKKIVLENNLSKNLPVKAKLILAGDKAELAQTFIAFNQNGHKDLLLEANNSNVKKIIENAYAYNETMRINH